MTTQQQDARSSWAETPERRVDLDSPAPAPARISVPAPRVAPKGRPLSKPNEEAYRRSAMERAAIDIAAGF